MRLSPKEADEVADQENGAPKRQQTLLNRQALSIKRLLIQRAQNPPSGKWETQAKSAADRINELLVKRVFPLKRPRS